MTLHTTSNEWIEKERSLGGDAELEEEFSDEASEMEDNMELDPDYHSSDGEESEDEPEELETESFCNSRKPKDSIQEHKFILKLHNGETG
ncbi:hypothetical protein Q8A67_023300 [Cirrhinus molitorella]|uniref:Uncharacterized protein n=1 Tax=Cirrhinus molitorella TaxID=172907 RepID=A0AA88TE66_9TELE|nr:hypothetical protein Q8A67_023300 [Cirrhinus molitorella]